MSDMPLRARLLREAPPRQRVDLLRKALRSGSLDSVSIQSEFDDWSNLFDTEMQAPFRVLLLELLAESGDARAEAVARRALDDTADSVRYEGLRLLLEFQPDDAESLMRAHLADDGIEVRLLAAERIFPLDAAAARESLLALIEAESLGPREDHALDRVTAFLVDEVGDRASLPKLRELRALCEDPEGFLDWAIEKLESAVP